MTDETAHEPRMRQDAEGSYYSSDGAHLRLSPRDPLHLSNSFVLYNLALPGDDHAREASHRRHAAFHEAGHLWAAHRVGVRIEPVRLTERAPRLRSFVPADALLLAAAGPLALAVGVEVDICDFLGLEMFAGEGFGTSMAPSRWDFDPTLHSAPAQQERRSQTYRHHATHWVDLDDFCMRGSDSHTRPALEDLDWLDATLPHLLSQWWGVDRVARRLLAGTLVTGAEVAELLVDPGHPR